MPTPKISAERYAVVMAIKGLVSPTLAAEITGLKVDTIQRYWRRGLKSSMETEAVMTLARQVRGALVEVNAASVGALVRALKQAAELINKGQTGDAGEVVCNTVRTT